MRGTITSKFLLRAAHTCAISPVVAHIGPSLSCSTLFDCNALGLSGCAEYRGLASVFYWSRLLSRNAASANQSYFERSPPILSRAIGMSRSEASSPERASRPLEHSLPVSSIACSPHISAEDS